MIKCLGYLILKVHTVKQAIVWVVRQTTKDI